MGKKTIAVLLFLLLTALCGCTVKKLDSGKIREVEFSVVAKDEIPEELHTRIKRAKETPLKQTYGDDGYLYIARGYGTQDTSGYRIEVKELYETKNAIYIETELKGPKRGEEVADKETSPYIVVKIEYTEKTVVFD